MKFAVASEHREYFHKHHTIEFEGLLSPENLRQLDESVQEVLAGRLGIPKEQLRMITTDKKFKVGHDLWRDSPAVKKNLLHSRFAELAADLIQQRPLRYGCDQYFPASPPPSNAFDEETPYQKFLASSFSLEEITSIQGVLCGLMICLSAPKVPVESPNAENNTSSVFSHIPGNGVFFDPSYPIQFSTLFEKRGASYILLVYTQQTSVYVLQQKDPQGYFLKNLGYGYGDRLTDKLHPILIR